MPLLEDLDALVIDALRVGPHDTHMSIGEALAASRAVGARRTFFTHLSPEIDYESTSADLPATISLAHDGLKLHF